MTLIRQIATERNDVFAISGDMVTLIRRTAAPRLAQTYGGRRR
jgi:hypothetical protein